MISYLLFPIGFLFVIKGADFLIKGSSSIGRQLGFSELGIGLTVVSFGTSLPELFVNISASLSGNTAIAISNILGSNTANILLILGLAALIAPLTVSRGIVWREIPFSLLAALMIAVLGNDRIIDHTLESALTRIDGLVLLAFFIIFLYYTYSIGMTTKDETGDRLKKKKSYGKDVLLIVTGLAGLIIGGKWIVDGAILITKQFGISQSLVGVTIVAVGTSLPELATSLLATWKRNFEIAVGNIVGSNIFNIFFILGLSSLIRPLPFTSRDLFDVGVVIASSLFLFLTMFTWGKRTLDRKEGFLLVVLYLAYITFLVFKR